MVSLSEPPQMMSRLDVPSSTSSPRVPLMVHSGVGSGARLNSDVSLLPVQPGSRRSVLPSPSLSLPSEQAGFGAGGSGSSTGRTSMNTVAVSHWLGLPLSQTL